jgi:hypothetical protein
MRPTEVERDMQRRRGQCNRCGASCKLLFRCPAFDDSDGSPKCLIYNDRPGVCGLFPISEKDIEERNLVSPSVPCGYVFVNESRPIPAQDRRLLRNGRRFSLRGSLNIVRYAILGKGKPNGSKIPLKPYAHPADSQLLASLPPKE